MPSKKPAKFFLVLMALVLAMANNLLAEEQAPSLKSVFLHRLFQQGNYEKVLLLAKRNDESPKNLLLIAESLYRLGNFDEARNFYLRLMKSNLALEEKKVVYARAFFSSINLKDRKKSIELFESFRENFGEAPDLMIYGLGQLLFENDYEKNASQLLALVKEPSLIMRARFLQVLNEIEDKPLKKSLEDLITIEELPNLSVEDYSVKPMVILSQARLLWQLGREEESLKTYARVEALGPQGTKAAEESIKSILNKIEMIEAKTAPYEKLKEEAAFALKEKWLKKAQNVLLGRQRIKPIDISEPGLFGAMAMVSAKAGRFDDARLAMDKAISFYKDTLDVKYSSKLMPYFAIDYFAGRKFRSLAEEFPRQNILSISKEASFIKIKNKIVDLGQRLIEIKEASLEDSISDEIIFRQKELENNYNEIAMLKQNKIISEIKKSAQNFMADLEYKRAEISDMEMAQINKKLEIARQFQLRKSQDFEKQLEETTKGGSL